MSRNVGVPFLVPLVLLDKMEIIPPNNNSPVHLSTVTCSSQDTATDGNIASEGALLVNVGSFDGFPGSLKSKPNGFPKAVPTLSGSLSLPSFLRAEKHFWLFQKSLLGLLSHGE